MSASSKRVEVAPEVLDELRQILAEAAPVQVPPRFEIPEDEPAPWSVPPPGGFAELRAKLHQKRAS